MFPAREASDILQHGLGTDVFVHLKPNTQPSRDDVLHCNTTGKYATLDWFLFVIAPRGHSNPSSSSFNACCQNTIFKSRGVQARSGREVSQRLSWNAARTHRVRNTIDNRVELHFTCTQCAQVSTVGQGWAGPESRFLDCRHSSQEHWSPSAQLRRGGGSGPA